MSRKEDDDLVVVPLPGEESKAEHDRIRKSNDRDQELEREGKKSRHNRATTRWRTWPCPIRKSPAS
jgi:hypothetical protein